jgi:hypothetical protein
VRKRRGKPLNPASNLQPPDFSLSVSPWTPD